MTDPIIQNQAQGGQTPAPAQIDFDLNLPTDEVTSTNEEPVISLDFEDLEKTQIDNPQQTNVNDSSFVEEKKPEVAPVVEATPIVEATPVIEVAPVVEVNVIANDNEAIQADVAPVIEVTPVVEIKEDNRLEKEDALVEENKKPVEVTPPVIEAKEAPEVKEESLNMFSEPTEKVVEEPIIETAPVIETPVAETPVVEQPIEQEIEKPVPGEPAQNFPPSTNLQQDHAIIQQLQQSAGKTADPVQTITTLPSATEVNLDDLLNAPTPTNQVSVQTNMPAPVPQMPAFTGIQGYSLPPIATQISQQIKKPMNKKILINFGVGIVALLIGGFMFKTMYPLEYQKFMGNTAQTGIENELTNTTPVVDETATGGTGADGLFENPALANYHAAADETGSTTGDFNAFEDIEQTMDEDTTKTKEQLQNYIDQGKKYLVIGKKTKDKDITKYSLFLWKKASALLLDIENGTQISTSDLDTQLADFQTYLEKLTGTGSNDQILPTQPTPPTPEEFFGSENSGTTQEETVTPAEIPTTDSGSATQETETPDENLSGDTNTVNSTNDLNG